MVGVAINAHSFLTPFNLYNKKIVIANECNERGNLWYKCKALDVDCRVDLADLLAMTTFSSLRTQ